jgi:hypothetical protein
LSAFFSQDLEIQNYCFCVFFVGCHLIHFLLMRYLE